MPKSKLNQFVLILSFQALGPFDLRADQVLYRYEGDALPYAPGAGWIIADECEPPCSESLVSGAFHLSWPQGGNLANYHHWIAQSPTPPPSTLWVEWRFRSNHPMPTFSFSCDAQFTVRYIDSSDGINMYGDSAVAFGGNAWTDLPMGEWQTFRFESMDGSTFTYAANGEKFYTRTQDANLAVHYLQFRGRGGCIDDQIPNAFNDWDFIRYGTIGSGEQVVSTTPLSGALGPSGYTSFTSFLVTFDQPNYVYVNDITVSVSGDLAPVVTATRRTDTHDEHTVEIVLDRALPPNELTTFTLTDGTSTTDIHYDFRAAPAAIPTMSAGGMLVFSIALLVAGCFVMRGRAAQGGTVGSEKPLELIGF